MPKRMDGVNVKAFGLSKLLLLSDLKYGKISKFLNKL